MINTTPLPRPQNTDSITWKMGQGRLSPCWPYAFSFPCTLSPPNPPQRNVNCAFSPQLHLFFMFLDSVSMNASLPPITSNRTTSHACSLLMNIHCFPNVHHLHMVLLPKTFNKNLNLTITLKNLLCFFSDMSYISLLMTLLACYEPHLSIFIRRPLL